MSEVGWLIHEITPAKSMIGRFARNPQVLRSAVRSAAANVSPDLFFPLFFLLFFFENMLSGYVYKIVAPTREFHIDTARANYRRAD